MLEMESGASTEKRKLIFLWTYTTWGGAQVYFFAIMKLARTTWDILVILPQASKPDLLTFLDDLGVRYEFLKNRFDPEPEPSLMGKLRRQYQRIRSEIEAFRYLLKYRLSESILHIETAPWQSWILLSLLSLRRANVFATLHNFRPEVSSLRRAVWRLRFQLVSRLTRFHVFASNKDTLNSLKDWVTPAFWKTIKVTYTCIDPRQIREAARAKFDRDATREALGIPKSAFVVLSVGQFIDRKGRWTLLDAAQSCPSDVVFVWVMPAVASKQDQARVDSYELGSRFIPVLSGSVGSDRIDILKFFRIADAFALPSFVEGLPIALLEAMAMGIPSISTNVYAIPEAVVNGETGILIEAGDPTALRDSILNLKADLDLRRRLAADGSAFVMKNFDEAKAAAICIDSYRECFKRSPADR